MELSTTAHGQTVKPAAEVYSITRKVTYTKVIGEPISAMDLVNTRTRMAHFMKVTGKMIYRMVKESKSGQRDQNMKANT
jgi:UDP-2,3-diacylglucosamine pyrophosphatase LpxH